MALPGFFIEAQRLVGELPAVTTSDDSTQTTASWPSEASGEDMQKALQGALLKFKEHTTGLPAYGSVPNQGQLGAYGEQ